MKHAITLTFTAGCVLAQAQPWVDNLPITSTVHHVMDFCTSVLAEGDSDTLYWVFGGNGPGSWESMYLRRIIGECEELLPMSVPILADGLCEPLRSAQIGGRLYTAYKKRVGVSVTDAVYVCATDLLAPTEPVWVDSFTVNASATELRDMTFTPEGLFLCGGASGTSYMRSMNLDGSTGWIRTWPQDQAEGMPANLVIAGADLLVCGNDENGQTLLFRASTSTGETMIQLVIPEAQMTYDMAVDGSIVWLLSTPRIRVAADLSGYTIPGTGGYIAQTRQVMDGAGRQWLYGGNGDVCPGYGMTTVADADGNPMGNWYWGEWIEDMVVKGDRIYAKGRTLAGTTNHLITSASSIAGSTVLGGPMQIAPDDPMVYPEPSADVTTVRSPITAFASVRDATGRDVTSLVRIWPDGADRMKLDITSLGIGAYFLIPPTGSRTVPLRFTVAR